jgi:hypothetical protein
MFLAFALATLASLPFFYIGEDRKVGCCGGEMPITHDAWMHYNQMRAFAEGLAAGRIYPRWDEATHGFGAPTTSFYPPGIYYITSGFYFITRSWDGAWIGFYLFTMASSVAAFYFYAVRRMSSLAASIAAAVYAFAPYHLLNQYQRGAMGEFTSFIWIPLVLLFTEDLLEKDQPSRRAFAGLAASFAAFLWTHPPTAFQSILVFGPLLFLQAAWQKRWRAIGIVSLSLLFGSMLAAAYFYPAIAEQRLVNYDDIQRTWPYHASYVFDFTQQVYDRAANPFFGRLDRIWAFNAVIVSVLLAICIGIRKRLDGKLRQRAISIYGPTGMLSVFLMTRYSKPIGQWIPKIEIGVFSWRMLALTSFAAAILGGAVVEMRGRFQGIDRCLIVGIGAIALLATIAMSFIYVGWPMWRGQAFEPNPEHYNFATLPRGAPREVPQWEKVRLPAGQGRLEVLYWSPESRRLRVDLPVGDRLQFRTFCFSGWTAMIDGVQAPIQLGAYRNIELDLPAGTHEIRLEFLSTTIRRASNWISVVSGLGLVLLCLNPASIFKPRAGK